MVTPASGDGRLRASHADREQVVDTLKAAFVQGRLTQDELDARVGQALAARTYADLAALTADRPGPARAPSPAPALSPAPAPARTTPHGRAVKVGASAIGAVVLTVCGTAAALGQPVAAAGLAVIFVLLTAVSTAFVAALIAVALNVESRHRNRSRRRLPPPSASRTDASAPPDPPGSRPRRPHGLLAVRRAREAGSPALPRGGRTDRRLAPGHRGARPGGLGLAGQAGRVRRG
jgi:Domain of unknown function (DUF1707)